MDDQQTYLLNGLLNRHFGLGRIVRFRPVKRGRQAESFELLTAQQREYLVQLYPPAITVEQLETMAHIINTMDEQRFSVVPFVKNRAGTFTAEGPQNSHMMVSLAPPGSAAPPTEYSEHDISQVGLRLGWMHRLLQEHAPVLPPLEPMAERLRAVAGEGQLDTLMEVLVLPVRQGWAHGDIGPDALLVNGDRQLSGIVDWGLMHPGTPLEDVVDAFLSFCTDGEGRLASARGAALLEAYHSMAPIKNVAWTPAVAWWCAQRVIDASARRRALPRGFDVVMRAPEGLGTAMASCV